MDPTNAWMDTGWVTVGNTQYQLNSDGSWNGQSKAKAQNNQNSQNNQTHSQHPLTPLSTREIGVSVAERINPKWFEQYIDSSMYYGEDAGSINSSLRGYHYLTTKGDPTSYLYYKVDNGNVICKRLIPGDSVADGHMETKTIPLSDIEDFGAYADRMEDSLYYTAKKLKNA